MATASGDGKRVDQVMDLIKEMSMLELRDLNQRIQDEFGVTAAAPVAVAAPAAAGAGAPAGPPCAWSAEWPRALCCHPVHAPPPRPFFRAPPPAPLLASVLALWLLLRPPG